MGIEKYHKAQEDRVKARELESNLAKRKADRPEIIATESAQREADIANLEAFQEAQDAGVFDDNAKKMSVTEFNQNPEVIKNYDIVMDYMSDESGTGRKLADLASVSPVSKPLLGGEISESMRDDMIRFTTMINKANLLKNAPPEVAKAYRELRHSWENKTEIKGFLEGLDATADYGIDMLASYEAMPLILSAIFNPVGTSTAVIQGRAALQSILKYKGGIPALGITGGGITAAHDMAYQQVLIDSDYQDAYDTAQGQLATTIGTLITPAAAKGLPALGSKVTGMYKKVTSKTDEKHLKDSLEVVPNDAPVETQLEFDFMDQVSVQQQLDLADPEIAALSAQTVDNLNLDKMFDQLEDAQASTIQRQGTLDFDPTMNQISLDLDNPNFVQTIDNYVEQVGGGEATKEEVVDAVSSIMSDAKLNPVEKQNKITFYLTKLGTDISGKYIAGKSAGILTPYVKASPTARRLRSLLAHEFDESFKPLTPQQDQIGLDLFEVATRYTGAVNERFMRIIEPLALNKIKGTMQDSVIVDLNKAIRGGVSEDANINQVAREIQDLFKEMGEVLEAEGLIDEQVENYIPRMWNKKAIVNNKLKFKELLVEQGEAKDLVEAEEIFKSLDAIENQIGDTGAGHFFSAQRKFINIKDDSAFVDFFEPDIMSVFHQYTYQAGKALAKKRVLKSTNSSEFESVWIDQIEKEMADAGITMTRSQKTDIMNLYKVSTGEVTNRMSSGFQNAADAYAVTNRFAYLPFAALSSLGEIFINVGKAGTWNSVKGFTEASELAFKTAFKDIHSNLQTRNGLTPQESWLEMKRFNIGVTQAVSQIGNRLGGDDLSNKGMQDASNKFFRFTLLDQWTRFVQTVSFSTGKNAIQADIATIANNGSLASSRRVNTAKGRLRELNIDPEEAVNWYNNGSNTDDFFYDNSLLSGAARYTNSVILQPTAMSNTKPLWHSHPNTTAAFGLLSYPTAFTNTVLKGGLKQLSKNPETSVNLALAGLLIANTNRFTNYVRTRGKSEDKPLNEVYMDALVRSGGNTVLLDQINRAKRNVQYTKNPAYYLGLPFGPLASDTIELVDKDLPVAEFLGEKVPFYGASRFFFGEDAVKNYRENLREIDKDIKEAIVPKRDFRNKGGIIEIARASTEPDERIDKTTGIPYNQQAGTAFIDVLDRAKRETFNVGSVVARELSGFLSEKVNDVTSNMFKPETINKATDEIKQTVVPALQALKMEAGEIDSIVTSKVEKIVNNEPVPDYPTFSAVEDLKINKALAQALKPMITKKVSLIDDTVDSSEFNDEMYKPLVKYTSMRLLRNKTNADVFTKEGITKAAKNSLARIVKSNPETKEMFKEISGNLPDTFDPKTIPASVDPVFREGKLQEMLQDSVVKTRVYRGVSAMLDTDKEIGFSVPREMGVHVGTVGQANFIVAKALSSKANKMSMTSRRDRGQSPRASMQEYQDFFDDQYNRINKANETLSEDGESVAPNIAIMSGYVNLKNPLTIYEDYGLWDAGNMLLRNFDRTKNYIESGLGRDLSKEESSKLESLQLEVFRSRKFSDDELVESLIENANEDYIELKVRFSEAKIDKQFQKFLKGLGFDGIKYSNQNETSLMDESSFSYILFDPEQFKNVNSVEFDTNNPRDMFYGGGRLTYSEGSEVGSYIVKQGDTLTAIAKKHGTTIEMLSEINSIKNPNDISVDDVLNITVPPRQNKAATAIKNLQTKRPKDKALKALTKIKEIRSNVDWDFISTQENAAKDLNAVVPAAKTSQSGVTVASGFDLGARTVEDLKDLPKALQKKLAPYVGLKKEQAVEFLKAHPLVITAEEYEVIDRKVHREVENKLARQWEEATGTLFSSLPKGKSTVLASLATQYGDLPAKTPTAWGYATTGDWKGFATELQDFKDDYGSRRLRENDYWYQSDPVDYFKSIGDEDMATREQMLIDSGQASEDRQAYAFGTVAQKAGRGIYSALEEAADWIANRGAKEADGEHYINIIKKAPNVTNDEIEWSGVGDKLRVKRTFTKQEVQDMLKNSPVKLKIAQSGKDFDSEYSKYTLAGDDKVPTREYDPMEADMPAFRPDEEDATVYDDIDPMEQALTDFAREEARVRQEPKNYKEFLFLAPKEGKFSIVQQYDVDHFRNFKDSNKTLFHVRLSQGTDLETDKPLTIIEEMQSDYHTTGRKEGYFKKEDVDLNVKDGEFNPIATLLKGSLNLEESSGMLDDGDAVLKDIQKVRDKVLAVTRIDIDKNIKDIEDIDLIQSRLIFNFASKFDLDPMIVRESLSQRVYGSETKIATGFDLENIEAPELRGSFFEPDDLTTAPRRMLSKMRYYSFNDIVDDRLDPIIKEITGNKRLTKKAKVELEDYIEELAIDLQRVGKAKEVYLRYLRDRMTGGHLYSIADAPFKDTWYKSAINKAIIEALDEGHSGVALTKADTHAARYSEEYRKGYEFVYDNKGKSYLNKLGKRYGLKVEDQTIMVDTVENVDNPPADVFVLRFNDKLIKDLKEKGLPQFAEGGVVHEHE